MLWNHYVSTHLSTRHPAPVEPPYWDDVISAGRLRISWPFLLLFPNALWHPFTWLEVCLMHFSSITNAGIHGCERLVRCLVWLLAVYCQPWVSAGLPLPAVCVCWPSTASPECQLALPLPALCISWSTTASRKLATRTIGSLQEDRSIGSLQESFRCYSGCVY